jgi:CDP-diacylglycerol--serine O-phosphatidyltransferase
MLRPPRRLRVRRITPLALHRLLPNMLTLLALCAGMTAIRFALDDRFEWATVSVIVAAVLDGLDGTIARLLKATSIFGAQLDSLSDFVSFGVAPAVLLYLWTMHDLHSLGWVLVLLFGVCCALRLARFNTQIGVERPAYAQHFFTGVPAPAAAGLVLMPLFFYFEFGAALFRSPYLCGAALAGVAALMVSRVPTYSIKPHVILWAVLRVPGGRGPLLLLAGLAALVAFFTTEPWATLLVISAAYLASIPHSIRNFGRLRAAAERRLAATPESAEPPAAEEPHSP